jgi:hypothetical protein
MEPLQVLFYDHKHLFEPNQNNVALTVWQERSQPPREGDYITIHGWAWEVRMVVWRSSTYVDVYCAQSEFNF